MKISRRVGPLVLWAWISVAIFLFELTKEKLMTKETV